MKQENIKKMIVQKVHQAIKNEVLPPSAALNNAIYMAKSETVNFDILAEKNIPLIQESRQDIIQAIEKSKLPGAQWKPLIEKLIDSFWVTKTKWEKNDENKAEKLKKPMAQKGVKKQNRQNELKPTVIVIKNKKKLG